MILLDRAAGSLHRGTFIFIRLLMALAASLSPLLPAALDWPPIPPRPDLLGQWSVGAAPCCFGLTPPYHPDQTFWDNGPSALLPAALDWPPIPLRPDLLGQWSVSAAPCSCGLTWPPVPAWTDRQICEKCVENGLSVKQKGVDRHWTDIIIRAMVRLLCSLFLWSPILYRP